MNKLISCAIVIFASHAISYEIDKPSLNIFDETVHLGKLNTTCSNRMKTIFVNRALEESWLNAHLICQDYGMQLLTIADEVEQNAVIKVLEGKYCECETSVYFS